MCTEIRGEDQAQRSAERLSICYNPSIPPAQLAAFNLLVLDSAYPEQGVKQLRDQGKTVIGYMSLGAVGENRWWFEALEKANALRGQNPGFASQVIKLDKPVWKKLVIQRIIPEIINRGFNGVFLDDLDLIYQTHQQRAAVELIAEIRTQFPELKIMANRGLEYLKDFSKQVDYVLLESCVTG
ncbi:MAG: endo alpha-1,4 polygalactosaminidase [Verrucomicrobiota bacterium]